MKLYVSKQCQAVYIPMETELFRAAGITRGKRVLDIGFKDPQELVEIAELIGPEGTVLGIDVEVKLASQQSLPPNVIVKQGSVLSIPVEDGSFDIVFSKGVLHEVKNLKRAVAEMVRVCDADGQISIVDFERFSRLKFELYRVRTILRTGHCDDVRPGLDLGELKSLLSSHGFAIVQTTLLSEKWRLGGYRLSSLLINARRVKRPNST